MSIEFAITDKRDETGSYLGKLRPIVLVRNKIGYVNPSLGHHHTGFVP
ncbi:MAG: hypothetical protein O2868_15185 [Proteobacteria bacterium]|nr:hypothetical protein [Pseudomonadota bacterium]